MATGDSCLSEHSISASVSKVVHLQRPPRVGASHKMSFKSRVRMCSLKIARQHLHDELPDINWIIKRVIPPPLPRTMKFLSATSHPPNINWDIFSGISEGKHFPFQRQVAILCFYSRILACISLSLDRNSSALTLKPLGDQENDIDQD